MQNHFWQSYSCGCTSPLIEDDRKLLASCPKHGNPFLQRYVTNKLRGSISQMEDNEQPVLGITKEHIHA